MKLKWIFLLSHFCLALNSNAAQEIENIDPSRYDELINSANLAEERFRDHLRKWQDKGHLRAFRINPQSGHIYRLKYTISQKTIDGSIPYCGFGFASAFTYPISTTGVENKVITTGFGINHGSCSVNGLKSKTVVVREVLTDLLESGSSQRVIFAYLPMDGHPADWSLDVQAEIEILKTAETLPLKTVL